MTVPRQDDACFNSEERFYSLLAEMARESESLFRRLPIRHREVAQVLAARAAIDATTSTTQEDA